MENNKIAPIFWISILGSLSLLVLKLLGVWNISWLLVPYPILTVFSLIFAVSALYVFYGHSGIKKKSKKK